MTYLESIILGFIQGATEFIPISSSGHLIIVREFLGVSEGGLAFDAILQLASVFAVILYFWKDIVTMIKTVWFLLIRKPIEQKEKTLVWAIVLGTIPAVIFGLFLEETMDTIFRNVHLVSLTLILGSFLFWYAEKKATQDKILSISKGIKIGFFQCLALIPGVSRSGATISGGLLSGLTRGESARFSFLLSLPVLLGAGMKKFFDVRNEIFAETFFSPLLVGSIVSFLTGLIAIHFLVSYLKKHDLKIFIWYRIVLAVLLIIFI